MARLQVRPVRAIPFKNVGEGGERKSIQNVLIGGVMIIQNALIGGSVLIKMR